MAIFQTVTPHRLHTNTTSNCLCIDRGRRQTATAAATAPFLAPIPVSQCDHRVTYNSVYRRVTLFRYAASIYSNGPFTCATNSAMNAVRIICQFTARRQWSGYRYMYPLSHYWAPENLSPPGAIESFQLYTASQ